MADVCKECGVPVKWSGIGRHPSVCPAHKNKANKSRDKKRAKRRLAVLDKIEDAAKDRLTIGDVVVDPSWYPHLLAVGLSMTDDAVQAAKLFGVAVTTAELPALLIEARKLTDLTRRKPAAIGALLTAAISSSAIRLAACCQQLAPHQLPGAIRALAQSNELLCGSALPTTGSINISIKGE